MRKGERYNIHYINRDYIYNTITQQKKREGERDTKQLGKKGCIFFFFSRPEIRSGRERELRNHVKYFLNFQY